MAVAADACAAPEPSKPNPFLPSPARDQAVLLTVGSATALEGPVIEIGARNRDKTDVVAFASPSSPTASRWPPAAWMPATVAKVLVVVRSGVCAEGQGNKSPPFFCTHPVATAMG